MAGPSKCPHEGCGVFIKAGEVSCKKHSAGVTAEPVYEDEMEATEPEEPQSPHGVEAEVDPRRARAYLHGYGEEYDEELVGRAARARKPKPVRPDDPEIEGHDMARWLQMDEARQRLEMASERRVARDRLGNRLPRPKLPTPFRVLPRRRRPDPSRIIDPLTGEPPASLRAGWHWRWVTTVDHEGRPIEENVANFLDYGGEFVTDAEGNPIYGRFGVAMQMPKEQYAVRVADNARTGAYNEKESRALSERLVDQINSVADEEVVSITPVRGHGKTRREHRYGREDEE